MRGEKPIGEADPRKGRCEELAGELARPGGRRLARLLQYAGYLNPPPAPVPPSRSQPAEPAADPRPISIWQPRERDGEVLWERPPPLALGDHYAARRFLTRKRPGGPRRVCFFGESAAAGYLYAPHLTPAGVLQAQLDAAAGVGNWEVLDLARTNESLPPLLATVESALQLQPDVLVVYAGNNWNLHETPRASPYVPSVRTRQRYALALREGGLEGPRELAAYQLERDARRALDALAALAARGGSGREGPIPVVLVVPEVNLGDWETLQPCPWLPGAGGGEGGGARRWHAACARARRRLARGDGAGVEVAAREMLALDGGLTSTPHRLLARAALARGEEAAAAACGRAEVDAAAYATLCFLSAPQATGAAQGLLREAAERHRERGWELVDLPRIFAEHTASPLPGRRLFLDYCHLTAEGMGVAMAAVAERVLRRDPRRGGDAPGWRELVARLPPPRPAPEAEALACFGAAVHGAHRLLAVGEGGPVLRHWCRRALEISPGIAGTMLDYIEARAAPCPAVLTAAQQRNFASPYRLQLQHGWRYDHLDAELVLAAVDALEEMGRPARRRAAELLVEHRGIRREGVELVHPPYYLWHPLARFYPEVMSFEDLPGRATHRSAWPTSDFCLVTDGGADVGLTLTARLPAIAGYAGRRRGTVRVLINGHRAGEVALGRTWLRAELAVPRRFLAPGLNRLRLAWPAPPAADAAALEGAVRRLEEGIEADLHPVFGEVFSLRARSL